MRVAPDPVSQAQRLQATLAAVAAAPWRFDYYHALRLIDAQQPHRPPLGTAPKPSDEPIRLGQAPELSFAPQALHTLQWPQAGQAQPPKIQVRFFGLFGPNGPLPLHLTEHARERSMHHGDATFAAFADLFHHRLLLLFYRAWAQAQPTVGLDRPGNDSFAAHVGTLAGQDKHPNSEPTPTAASQANDAALHFTGLLARQARSAEGLEALLSGWLARPVKVQQFQGAWLPLRQPDRTRIGRSLFAHADTRRLGHGAVLGQTVWDRQHHFSLHIGPLDHDTFTALLPDGAALPVLEALVLRYLGSEFSWHLNLALNPKEVRPLRLGQHGRLGWDSWLPQPHDTTNRSHGASHVEPVRLNPAQRPHKPKPHPRITRAAVPHTTTIQ